MSVKASTQYAGLSAHTCTSGREIVRRVLGPVPVRLCLRTTMTKGDAGLQGRFE